MPVTRFGGAEEEILQSTTKPQVELLNALKTNRAISDAIITEINNRYSKRDLSSALVNAKAIHVSFSWG